MSLSIIIASYKNPELLKLCINSIQMNVKGVEYEIIVSDSETQEDTEMMMREEFPDIKFFPFKNNVGFGALLKKAIENSSGKYLLLLNGDILVKENSVEELIGFLNANPSVGMVGPKLLNFNETLQYSCFRFYKWRTILYRRTFLGRMPFAKKHLDWFLMMDYDHKSPTDVDWLMGSAMMIPNEAIRKTGLMDPRFFLYMEDVDWCRRFWENNFRVVYYPLVTMLHYHGKGSGKGGVLKSLMFNKLTWIHIFSALKYFAKYFGKSNPREEYLNKNKN